jgi:hypothetical protein
VGRAKVSLDLPDLASAERAAELVALDEALDELAKQCRRALGP